MSHLFNMFVKQVADYCDTSSMPGKDFLHLLVDTNILNSCLSFVNFQT